MVDALTLLEWYVDLQHAFHSFFTMLLIAAVPTCQRHATYTVICILFFLFYILVIPVDKTLNSALVVPKSVEKGIEIVR